MASGKLPPRQKMIGMMYLVLTALLAMNVSKEVLNAFVVVNTSLINTNNILEDKNSSTLRELASAANADPGKAGFFHEQAVKAQQISSELFQYIDALKEKLIADTDKKDEAAADTLKTVMQYVDAKDNYDVPTQIMIGGDEGNLKTGPFTAAELRSKIEGARDQLKAIFNDGSKFSDLTKAQILADIDKALTLPEKVVVSSSGEEQSWELANFYHLPLAAVITNLSKIQTDVKNVEADVLRTLKSGISELDFKFDRLDAKVIAKSNYVLIGEPYEAEVLLVASNSTSNPEVHFSNSKIDTTDQQALLAMNNPMPVEGGVGKYTIKPQSEGEQTWGGVIKVEKPGKEGEYELYPFTSTYIAAKPALVVSPTKMNVLYIGVDNPIEISVPGIAASNLVPSLAGSGTLSGSNGKYIAKVRGGKDATINVSAKMNDGTTRSMGGAPFRVKRVPDPVAEFAGKKGSTSASKNELANAAGVIAKMENFDFDLTFNITEFAITATVGGYEKSEVSRSNRVTADQKAVINSVRPGAKVFIEKIKAKGPDGTIRELSPIIFTVR